MFQPSRPARKGARIRGKGFVLPFVRVYVYDRFARTNGDSDGGGGGGGGAGLEMPKITDISTARPDDARFSSLSMDALTRNERARKGETRKERDRVNSALASRSLSRVSRSSFNARKSRAGSQSLHARIMTDLSFYSAGRQDSHPPPMPAPPCHRCSAGVN